MITSKLRSCAWKTRSYTSPLKMRRSHYFTFLLLTVALVLKLAHTDQDADLDEGRKRLLALKNLSQFSDINYFGDAVLRWLDFEEKSITAFVQSLRGGNGSSLSYNDEFILMKMQRNESKCFIDMLTAAVATVETRGYAIASKFYVTIFLLNLVDIFFSCLSKLNLK